MMATNKIFPALEGQPDPTQTILYIFIYSYITTYNILVPEAILIISMAGRFIVESRSTNIVKSNSTWSYYTIGKEDYPIQDSNPETLLRDRTAITTKPGGNPPM